MGEVGGQVKTVLLEHGVMMSSCGGCRWSTEGSLHAFPEALVVGV